MQKIKKEKIIEKKKKKNSRRILERDYFSMVFINTMRVRSAVTVLMNSVYINVQTNMAAKARRINLGILNQSQITPNSF